MRLDHGLVCKRAHSTTYPQAVDEQHADAGSQGRFQQGLSAHSLVLRPLRAAAATASPKEAGAAQGTDRKRVGAVGNGRGTARRSGRARIGLSRRERGCKPQDSAGLAASLQGRLHQKAAQGLGHQGQGRVPQGRVSAESTEHGHQRDVPGSRRGELLAKRSRENGVETEEEAHDRNPDAPLLSPASPPPLPLLSLLRHLPPVPVLSRVVVSCSSSTRGTTMEAALWI